MNKELAIHIVQSFLDSGGQDVCVCPGSRNSPLVSLLATQGMLAVYYFYEERSAAFFALGLSQQRKRPVAIITTSGTAAMELMPAMAESYYVGTPLLAITADRPRSYRGTNAPQSCEQVGLYGLYANWTADVEGVERVDLQSWSQEGPAHINVCFDEPLLCQYQGDELRASQRVKIKKSIPVDNEREEVESFLQSVEKPLVVVGALQASARPSVASFLRHLNAPVYFDGTSGLRECPSLQHLRLTRSHGVWESAKATGYAIDGVLRIGGVPTVRLWRDLEGKQGAIAVCSLSENPFSGLSWGGIISGNIGMLLHRPERFRKFDSFFLRSFLQGEAKFQENLKKNFREEPAAEASLIHQIAERLPKDSLIYLGNSSPIREWDLAAPYDENQWDIRATRGLSGIDGQISTFLGVSAKGKSNWAFLGDLTTLYDMAGLWIAEQLPGVSFNLIVINNQGGQIFSRMYKEPQFLNTHQRRFKPLADFWSLEYERWEVVPAVLPTEGRRLIELAPDPKSSDRFWQKLLGA